MLADGDASPKGPGWIATDQDATARRVRVLKGRRKGTHRSLSKSLFPSFHKLSVQERVRTVRDRGLLSSRDYKALLNGDTVLDVNDADNMIENVIGVMGLPVGLGVNFMINGKDYVVPLAVEEPSIVAALSFAAKTARSAGGFTTSSNEPILIGQIQLVDVPKTSKARQILERRKDEVLNLANSLHPRMVARGGGAVDLEVILHPASNDTVEMLNSLYRRDSRQNNLAPTTKPGIRMRNHRADSYLEVTMHYLSINANISSITGSTNISTIIKGAVIINRELGYRLFT